VWRRRAAHLPSCPELDPSLINLAMPIGRQIYNNHVMPQMVAKVAREGLSPERVIAGAERELEDFRR